MKTRLPLIGTLALPAVCVILLCATASRAATVYYVSKDGRDDGLITHLSSDLGHTVHRMNDSTTPNNGNYADAVAKGADLIIISGSISSSTASGRGYHTSRIPVINFEAYSYDDFGWTGIARWTDYADTPDDKQDIQIDDDSHPITAGFSTGSTAVYDTADGGFTYGVVHADADVLATYQGGGAGDGKATLFVYERGDTLKRGMTTDDNSVSQAQSRYIGFFSSMELITPTAPSQDMYDEMNANGIQLFDQAVAHALDPRRAHWTFDNDFTDAVGDNDGTAVGEASITNLIGESVLGDGALKLSKSNSQYVLVNGLAGELETGDEMTVSMWFNTTRGNSALDGLSMSDMSDNILFSAHNSAGSLNYFRMGTGVDGGIFLNATTSANDEEFGSGYNNGQWHLLAGTFASDGTTTIYVDGQEVSGFRDTADHPQWGSAILFSLGQEWDNTNPSNQYDGLIDDVQIWGRLLSVDEISALYIQGIPEPSSLVLLSLGLLGLSVRRRRRRQES